MIAAGLFSTKLMCLEGLTAIRWKWRWRWSYEYYDHMSIMIITQNLCRERRHSTSRPGSGTRQRTPSPPWATSTESRWTSNQHDLNEKYDSLRNCTALCLLFGDTSLNDVGKPPFHWGSHLLSLLLFHLCSYFLSNSNFVIGSIKKPCRATALEQGGCMEKQEPAIASFPQKLLCPHILRSLTLALDSA